MPTPEEMLRDGRLREALAAVQELVRSSPASPKPRILLFQLLSVLGDWQRALNQLDVLAELDAATLPMVHTYRHAIRCEDLRASVFDGRASPRIFGEPQRWLALLLEALRLTAEHPHQAAALRKEAFDMAPATAGCIDGDDFEWIADADSRLGPVLEAIVNGVYLWVPFERLKELRFEPPSDLRDLVWAPAQFVWANGGEAVGLVPTRYSGSESCEDAQIRLSRHTEWRDVADDAWVGLGQRMLATDHNEYPLLEVRRVSLTLASGSAEADDSPAGAEPAVGSNAG